ncbi:MAG: hypothetical protein OSB62_08905 [Alphaproteobacteria bacterium]|nr:hypothetical protein [Alphaproteobacteria bacterium]
MQKTVLRDGELITYECEAPTKQAVEEAAREAEISHIETQLAALDIKLRRDVEDIADAASITLSPYLESIRQKKRQLRKSL